MSSSTPAEPKDSATDARIDPDPLDVLEFDATTGKRATHEAFAFTPHGDGTVEVVNESHGADAREEHTYTVHVEHGIPFDCTCPAAEYHDGACKHQVAVALADPVREAATPQPATDGGTAEEEIVVAGDGAEVLEGDADATDAEEEDVVDLSEEYGAADAAEEERPEDCDCGEWNADADLACFPCYREGFDDPNPTILDENDENAEHDSDDETAAHAGEEGA